MLCGQALVQLLDPPPTAGLTGIRQSFTTLQKFTLYSFTVLNFFSYILFL
jgi:hypothetical protein